ncbi:UNVERIFIED_CONTAM: hypothetical protein NCL1_09684 [Trichonephila clavipes]
MEQIYYEHDVVKIIAKHSNNKIVKNNVLHNVEEGLRHVRQGKEGVHQHIYGFHHPKNTRTNVRGKRVKRTNIGN